MAESKRDYYEVLGIDKTATAADIKSAFRKKAKEWHPDLNKDKPEAAEKFKEVQEAYSVLSDDNKRKMYDQYGHAGVNNGSRAGYGNFGGGFSGFEGGDFDFSDIFDSIFGGAGSGGFSSFTNFGSGERAERATRGNDVLMRMNLTFEEAAFGCEKEFDLDVVEDCDECHGRGGFDSEECPTCHGKGVVITEQRTILGSFQSRTTCTECSGTGKVYKRSCTACHGTGKVKENKTITVNIPSGIDTGERLRVSGRGGAGSNGGSNGDLYLEFTVSEHPFYKREGDDIYLEVPLTITEAIPGAKKDIPTLYGNVKLNISAGIDSGDKERIRGKGIDNKHNHHKGDMYVIYKVVTPKKITRKEKELLEELNESLQVDADITKFNKFVEKSY